MGDLRFQEGVSPAEDGVPEPRHSVTVDDAIRVERDVAITLSDGTDIYADLFRPVQQTNVPVLIAWGPYGKHNGGAVYSQFKDESGRTGAGVQPAVDLRIHDLRGARSQALVRERLRRDERRSTRHVVVGRGVRHRVGRARGP